MKKKMLVLAFLLFVLSVASVSVYETLASTEGDEESSSSSQSSARLATVTVFAEDFEGAFPGTAWTVGDWNSGSGLDYWDDTSYKSHSGLWSGWCAQVGSHQDTVQIFYEDFEGAFPGTAWTVGDSDSYGGLDYWDDTSYRSFGGSWSCWCAGVGTQTITGWPNTGAHLYDVGMHAYMYRSVSLSGYTSVQLRYRFLLYSEEGYDYLQVIYSVGGVWYYVDTRSGSWGGWFETSVSIPTSATNVGFYFHSDSSYDYEGAYIDNVALWGVFPEHANTADHLIDTNMDAYMYRPVSLGGYASVSLSYFYWMDTEPGNGDYLQVIYYSGGKWNMIDTRTGISSGWLSSTVSIPTSATYVGFLFHSDQYGAYIWGAWTGAYIDDIVCTGTTAGVVFQDGFESGSFSAWSGVTRTTGETATAVASRAHHGVYSARFVSNGGGGTEVSCCRKGVALSSELYARGYFYVSRSGIVQEADRIFFLVFKSSSGKLAYAGWRMNLGQVRWVLTMRDGSGYVDAYSTTIPVLNRWYSVELHWKEGVSDGYGELRVDGVRVCYITNKNTAYYGHLKQVRFGLEAQNCGPVKVFGDCAKIATMYIGPET